MRALGDHHIAAQHSASTVGFWGGSVPCSEAPQPWRRYPPATGPLWTNGAIAAAAGIHLATLRPLAGVCGRLAVPLLSVPVGRGRGALAVLSVVSICREMK